MPAHRIPARKIGFIFHLLQLEDINYRKTARELKITRVTVKKYAADIRSYIRHFPDRQADDAAYLKSLRQEATLLGHYFSLSTLYPGIVDALTTGSTRKIEWAKYKAVYPQGHGYSQFCALFSRWCKENHQTIVPSQKRSLIFSDEDRRELIKWKRSNNKTKWMQAGVLLEWIKGGSIHAMAQKWGTCRRRIQKWLNLYKQSGLAGLEKKSRKSNEEVHNNIQRKKANLIKLLHETPKLHGINRSAWGIKTLAAAYYGIYGTAISQSVVSQYIREEGYSFKKAKRVLTSPDPFYREKLAKITGILAKLAKKEKFFSIDEFGPFAIKR